MIQVTRLNGSKYYINPVHMEGFEATPDVVVTLTNGKKLVVKETIDEMLVKLQDFYRSHGGLGVVIQQHTKSHLNEE